MDGVYYAVSPTCCCTAPLLICVQTLSAHVGLLVFLTGRNLTCDEQAILSAYKNKGGGQDNERFDGGSSGARGKRKGASAPLGGSSGEWYATAPKQWLGNSFQTLHWGKVEYQVRACMRASLRASFRACLPATSTPLTSCVRVTKSHPLLSPALRSAASATTAAAVAAAGGTGATGGAAAGARTSRRWCFRRRCCGCWSSGAWSSRRPGAQPCRHAG